MNTLEQLYRFGLKVIRLHLQRFAMDEGIEPDQAIRAAFFVGSIDVKTMTAQSGDPASTLFLYSALSDGFKALEIPAIPKSALEGFAADAMISFRDALMSKTQRPEDFDEVVANVVNASDTELGPNDNLAEILTSNGQENSVRNRVVFTSLLAGAISTLDLYEPGHPFITERSAAAALTTVVSAAYGMFPSVRRALDPERTAKNTLVALTVCKEGWAATGIDEVWEDASSVLDVEKDDDWGSMFPDGGLYGGLRDCANDKPI